MQEQNRWISWEDGLRGRQGQGRLHRCFREDPSASGRARGPSVRHAVGGGTNGCHPGRAPAPSRLRAASGLARGDGGELRSDSTVRRGNAGGGGGGRAVASGARGRDGDIGFMCFLHFGPWPMPTFLYRRPQISG